MGGNNLPFFLPILYHINLVYTRFYSDFLKFFLSPKLLIAKNNILVELWVMSGLRHERQDLLTLISEDIVNNSSVYQMIIEQGKELGAKASTIESILNLLDQRFKMSTASVLTPLLEPIDDLQQLRQLFHEALEVEHLENFIHTLQTDHNGA